ncbi:MAG: peptidylprolyl isomerase [bacterium]|nr:peptidylprolyl isomerase [bacterium]
MDFLSKLPDLRVPLFLACCVWGLTAQRLPAQVPVTDADIPGQPPTIAVVPETEEFTQAVAAFREHIKEMRKVVVRFNTGTAEEEQMWKDRWNELLQQGIPLYQEMLLAGAKEFEADPQSRVNIARWLFKVVQQNVDDDRFEGMLPIIKTLLKDKPESEELLRYQGMTAIALNEFDAARDSLSALASVQVGREELRMLQENLDAVEARWEKEKEIREQDAAGEPLPRVLIRTTKGDMEVELYENQAPDTVGNFIYLVESGFYDNQPFHSGKQHFLIQGGGDDILNPDYTIYGEMNRPDARDFYRGTLGMALSGNPDSGYSQFFIALMPNEELNGKYTAFGRVVKGIEVIANLNKIDPQNKSKDSQSPRDEPDEILEIRVLSKRDHDYVPRKVENPIFGN